MRAEYSYPPAGNAVLPIAAPVVGKAVPNTAGSTSTWFNYDLETAYARLNQSLASYNANGSPVASFGAPIVVGTSPTTAGAATQAVTNINSKTSPNLYSVRVRMDRTF